MVGKHMLFVILQMIDGNAENPGGKGAFPTE